MRHFLIKPTSRWAVLIGVLLLAAATMMAAKRDSDAKKAGPADQKTAQADPSQYVGSDTCKGCHDEAGKSIEASTVITARTTISSMKVIAARRCPKVSFIITGRSGGWRAWRGHGRRASWSLGWRCAASSY